MIYDCFTYCDEADLLDIRLHELDAVVDRFVLVEATRTFSGLPKQLHFAHSKVRRGRFGRKITHVAVTDADAAPDVRELPFYKTAATTNPSFKALIDKSVATWSREAHQRNAIMRGLGACRDEDIILIGDVDEVPRAVRFRELSGLEGSKVFNQRYYYYYLNCRADQDWLGTKAIRFQDLARSSPQEVRATAVPSVIDDGGWHFSYLGGVDAVRRKIASWSHQELNTAEINDAEALLYNIENNLDIFGRGQAYSLVDIDDSYPEHVRRHLFKYRRLVRREGTPDPNTVRLRDEVRRLRKENEELRRRLQLTVR
jgi:beta-1,4-mannosyl-glycoprotein beta-1,4-N-acetylglucosaminyltransferase